MKMVFIYGILACALLVFASPPLWAAPVPCVGSDLQTIEAARSDAAGSLKGVVNFLNASDTNTLALLKKWFGANDGSTASKVRGVFQRALDYINAVKFMCIYDNDGSLAKEIHLPNGSVEIIDPGQQRPWVRAPDRHIRRLYWVGLLFSACRRIQEQIRHPDSRAHSLLARWSNRRYLLWQSRLPGAGRKPSRRRTTKRGQL